VFEDASCAGGGPARKVSGQRGPTAELAGTVALIDPRGSRSRGPRSALF